MAWWVITLWFVFCTLAHADTIKEKDNVIKNLNKQLNDLRG